jgi:anti-anti-sigma factor
MFGKCHHVASRLDISPLTETTGLRLAGDLDFSTVPRLTEAIREFAPGVDLQLDLTELILVDSAGLHALLGLARTRGNRSLILVDPPASVMRSLEIAGIDLHPAVAIRRAGTSDAVRRTGRKPPPLRRAG